jgi:hypothetical protein
MGGENGGDRACLPTPGDAYPATRVRCRTMGRHGRQEQCSRRSRKDARGKRRSSPLDDKVGTRNDKRKQGA